MVLMMYSVEPTRSAALTTSYGALGVHQHLHAGHPLTHARDLFWGDGRAPSSVRATGSYRASRSSSTVSPPLGLNGL